MRRGQTRPEGTGTRIDAAGWRGHLCPSAAQLQGCGSALLSFSSPRFKVTLENVNGRERDTSARKSAAQQPHPGTGGSSAWHWRRLEVGGMDLEQTIQPFPGQTTGMYSPMPSMLSPARVIQSGWY